MVLNRTPVTTTTRETLSRIGIGNFVGLDLTKLHVAIAAIIDDEYAMQDEPKEITRIVDETTKMMFGKEVVVKANPAKTVAKAFPVAAIKKEFKS